MIFTFANCELDVERRELRREGSPVRVEPQVFDILLHLIRSRDRVVSKDELLTAVWQGRIVSEATLSSRISAARRAIGDSGDRQSQLRTVARRGFRFCCEVEERESQPPLSAGSAPGAAAAGRGHATITNLPAQPAGIFGRDKDLADVVGLLGCSRLVTLMGVGGVGKTRLALHAASAVAADYPDGVWLVELAAVTDPRATGHAVAGVLGVAQQSAKTLAQCIVSAIGGRRMLLVLDNCEHLVNAIASLAHEILARCPRTSLLATSREALMVEGEQSWPVPPLEFQDGIASPAVHLFAERARAVAPSFALDVDGAAVSEICRRLDGNPLAIELAAARTRAMSPSQIRDRLDERFQLLTGGSRGAQRRHQTLGRAVQWSYDLLSPAERAVLSRASVFAGGFMLEAAERVCAGGEAEAAAVLDLLDSLVRKSLVTVERAGSVLRYGLLETIRQFAAEQLAATEEGEAVRDRHAEFFAAASDANFDIWRSRRQLAAYEWLDREMGNLRLAFRWASDHARVDIAARIASNVGDMARFRMRDEAANWADEIVDAARRVRHRRLAVLLTWAASSAWSFARLAQARRYGEEAIALAGDANFDPFVWAFTDLGMVSSYEGDLDGAIEHSRAGAEHPDDSRDRFCMAMLPYFLAVGGCRDEAMKIADEAVALAEAAGVPSSISVAYWAKGEAFSETGHAVALAAYERAVDVARDSGNKFWEILIVPRIAALQARSGDPISALRSFERMLAFWRRSSDVIFGSHGLGGLIVLLERLGYLEAAASLNGTLTKMFESNPFVSELREAMTRARSALGDAMFDMALERGAAMSLHEATDYAVGEVRKAVAELGA